MKKLFMPLVGTLLLTLSSCGRHTPKIEQPRNKAPVIKSIPNQPVDEGGRLNLELKDHVSDPEGDDFFFEHISGPGKLFTYIRGSYRYEYEDVVDPDIVHNTHEIKFKARDVKGAESFSSFIIQQRDLLPAVLQPTSFRLSSGLESKIMDDFGGWVETRHRRPQLTLAVNSTLEPILLYEDNSHAPYGGDVVYAFQFGDVWIKKPLTSWGSYLSFLFDKNNIGHFCYDGRGTGEDLRYATFINGQWSGTRVDTNPSVGLDNDMAVDQNHKSHISYFSWAANRVKYATNASGAWILEDLTPAGWHQTSVATDLDNKAHVMSVTSNGIQYFTNMSGSWQGAVIASGTNPIIRSDRQGNLHVIFQRGGLQHGVKQGSTWNFESLPSVGGLYEGNRSSFEIDSANKLHICYLSGGRDSLYLMTDYSGSWKEHRLDNGGNWTNPRLTLDSQNKTHIIGARQGKVHYLTFYPSQISK